MVLTGTTLAMVTVTVLCTSTAQLLQKKTATQLNQTANNYVVVPQPAIVVSLLLLAIGMACWLVVLSRLDVSVAYPLLSVNFIVVPLMARLILGERLPAGRIAGSLLIVAGLCCMFTES